MKKMKSFALAAATMMLAACGTMGTTGSGSQSGNILGAVLTDVLQGGTISNVITSVIGAQTVTKANLIGSWRYTSPGCAFTSEKLLAKAVGEVAAAQIRTKVQPYYQQIGISSSNTYITFNEDGTYSAQFRGTPMSGNWTFDEKTYKVTLQGMLLNINCYAKRNANGIGLLFEAKKLLTLLQTMAAMSGNQNVQAVGEISKSYDGVRLGFDFSK
ncbi:MAG: DUF4923 family protein [Prevotella sp.]|nr:DUF4923 family protein [Prevotella sp.]